MTKLTRLILFSFLFTIFYVQTGYTQIISVPDNNMTILQASTGINDVYIPPNPSLKVSNVELGEVQIIVNYIGDNWTPAAIGAFDYAKGLWEEMLTTAVGVNIEIEAELVPQGTLGASGLGSSAAGQLFANFGADYDPAYFDETFYPTALANRLFGSDLSTEPDIRIQFVEDNNGTLWYFGTDGQCPSDKYDFVTAVLHEIGHGIGISMSNTDIFTYGVEVSDGVFFPKIADRFIVAGDESVTPLTVFPMGSAPLELLDYFTSDNLYWNTFPSGIKMYAPEMYNPTASIGHIDFDTYDGTEDGLFKHMLNLGEAIHTPGVGVTILRDIGWDVQLPVGIEDELELSYSFDIDCWNNPPCGDFYDLLYDTPVKEYNIGDTNYYDWVFYDNPPYSPVSSINWRVELLHSNGRYIYDSGSTGFYFGVTIGSLPSGYQWSRNIQGQIKAEIIISGTGSDGFFHEDILPIVINYQPDTPEVEFLYSGVGRSIRCNSVILSFYARGATSYNLRFKPEGSFSYTTQQIPAGQLTHEMTGLNESKNYDFIIEGINDHGVVSSQVLTRTKCRGGILVFPTIISASFRVILTDGGIIKQINVYNVNSGNLEHSVEGDNYSDRLDLNIASLPTGTYDIEVIDRDENSNHQIVFKY